MGDKVEIIGKSLIFCGDDYDDDDDDGGRASNF